jgi:hypothetical protein
MRKSNFERSVGRYFISEYLFGLEESSGCRIDFMPSVQENGHLKDWLKEMGVATLHAYAAENSSEGSVQPSRVTVATEFPGLPPSGNLPDQHRDTLLGCIQRAVAEQRHELRKKITFDNNGDFVTEQLPQIPRLRNEDDHRTRTTRFRHATYPIPAYNTYESVPLTMLFWLSPPDEDNEITFSTTSSASNAGLLSASYAASERDRDDGNRRNFGNEDCYENREEQSRELRHHRSSPSLGNQEHERRSASPNPTGDKWLDNILNSGNKNNGRNI